jgi:glycerophosphoryl diester phosphodiesterase
VNAWTARTWHDVKRLREAGVDGVIADYPLLTIAGGQ